MFIDSKIAKVGFAVLLCAMTSLLVFVNRRIAAERSL